MSSPSPVNQLPVPWISAVVSAPRPAPTLDATLASLARAGWTDPVVFCDYQRRGPLVNWFRAFECSMAMAERISGGDDPWVLICEDDIDITPGLRWWFDVGRRRKWTFVASLYCSAERESMTGDMRAGDGDWRFIRDCRPAGALAYVMPLSIARRIRWADVRLPKDAGADHWMPRACQQSGVSLVVHHPSFVLHAGTTTSLRRPAGDERFRNCRSFVERISDDGSFVVKNVGGDSGSKAGMAGIAEHEPAESEPGGEPGNR